MLRIIVHKQLTSNYNIFITQLAIGAHYRLVYQKSVFIPIIPGIFGMRTTGYLSPKFEGNPHLPNTTCRQMAWSQSGLLLYTITRTRLPIYLWFNPVETESKQAQRFKLACLDLGLNQGPLYLATCLQYMEAFYCLIHYNLIHA